jgi:hypothetical protein
VVGRNGLFFNKRSKALIHSDGAKVNFRERHKQIKLSTYGIIFMGTPHQGANVTLGSAILNIASVVIRTNRNLVMNLDRDSEYLQSQLEFYRGIRDDFATVYCYETKPTPPLNNVVSFFTSTSIAYVDMLKIVPSASAIGGARDASNVSIAKDHIQMVKFSSSSTHDYQRVKEHVQNMVASAAGPVEANWKDWDRSKGEYTTVYMIIFGPHICNSRKGAGDGYQAPRAHVCSCQTKYVENYASFT